jgi:ribosome-binding protein aMBF1 (putative translation factor)
MLSLSFRNPADATTLLPATAVQAQQTADELSEQPSAVEQVRQGVQVLLSEDAHKAVSKANKDADIDNSDLPDRIKVQLKLIRSMQAKIAKKMLEMQAFMSDRSLSPKAREAKIRQLQMETMAMTHSLIQATNGLNRSMQEMKLSLADRTLAGTLVSPQNLQS